MRSLLCESSSRCPLVSSLDSDPCRNARPAGKYSFYISLCLIKEKETTTHMCDLKLMCRNRTIHSTNYNIFECFMQKRSDDLLRTTASFFHQSHSPHLCQRLYFAFSLEGCCVALGLSSSGCLHFCHQLIVINTGKSVHLRVALWSAGA